MKKIAHGFALWSALYAMLTAVGSVVQLFGGVATDTNLNILARALICLVPIIAYYLFGFSRPQKWTRALLMGALHYALSLGCALLLIYLAGLIEKSGSTAYRDIAVSFTVAYAASAIAIAIGARRAKRAQDI